MTKKTAGGQKQKYSRRPKTKIQPGANDKKTAGGQKREIQPERLRLKEKLTTRPKFFNTAGQKYSRGPFARNTAGQKYSRKL